MIEGVTWLIKNYPLISTLITGILTAVSTYTFNKLRKRKEQAIVTGTEHDTVKRISHSSIETIERLNKSFEDLSMRQLEQRKEFAGKFNELTTQNLNLQKKIETLTIQNKELTDVNAELTETNRQLTTQNKELLAKLDRLLGEAK